MNAFLRTEAGLPQREKTLGVTVVLAVLLHALAFCGVHWTPTDAVQPAAREQGISIKLTPAPSPIPGRHTTEPARQLPPAVQRQPEQPGMEPAPAIQPKPTPKIARPRQQKPQKTSTAGTEAARTAAPTETAQSISPSHIEKEASSAATFAPEPMPSSSNPKPVYPQLARRRGQEGLVQLLANVDEKGTLVHLTVAKSSGFTLLDEAALAAVRKWRFKPGEIGGKASPGTLVVPIEFRLR